MSYYRDQLEKWLSWIDVQAESVLDVGGLAKPVKKRVRSWDVGNYKILDNGAEESNIQPDYFVDINRHVDMDVLFEVVFCLEVFEYIYNPVQALDNLYSFLKPNGIAYISFPSIYPVHNPQAIDYLRYTKAGIEKLLDNTGFESWEITPRIATNGASQLAQFYSQEGMHPVKDPVIFDIGYMVKAFKGGDTE